MPKAKAFIHGEMRQHVRDVFRILLPAVEVVQLFGGKLKLYHIVMVPQEHLWPRLIFNLSKNNNKGNPSVNNTTER